MITNPETEDCRKPHPCRLCTSPLKRCLEAEGSAIGVLSPELADYVAARRARVESGKALMFDI